MWARLRDWAAALRRDVLTLWFACRDPRTPLAARVLAVLIVAYALSPIDLIPDFIPVLGYLDDVILLPVAIYIALRMLPAAVLDAARADAAAWVAANKPKPRNIIAAALILCVWAAVLWWIWTLLAPAGR